MATGLNAATFWQSFGGGTPPELLGKPYFETSGMSTAVATATASDSDILVVGDFGSAYTIADRIGASVSSTDWIVGANKRPTGSFGYFLHWRVGGDLTNTDGLRCLRV